MRALAVELTPVRVNAVRPGPFALTCGPRTSPAQTRSTPSWQRDFPAQRVGEPDEVAKAYLHLIDSASTTGTVITIDGGQSLV